MTTFEKIHQFAEAARSLFVIGGWKWGGRATDFCPTEEDIRGMCWSLYTTAAVTLDEDTRKSFTYARSGRITCTLVRNEDPQFTLDITPR